MSSGAMDAQPRYRISFTDVKFKLKGRRIWLPNFRPVGTALDLEMINISSGRITNCNLSERYKRPLILMPFQILLVLGRAK